MKNLNGITPKNTTIPILLLMVVAIIMNVGCFVSTAVCAESDTPFTVHGQVSITESGYYQNTSNYPRLILSDNKPPLVSYVDYREHKAYFTELTDKGPNILATLPTFGGFLDMLQSNSDKQYLATKENRDELKQIKLFLFDREKKEINLQREYSFKISGKGKNEYIGTGLFPFRNKFLVFGEYEERYFFPWVFVGGEPLLCWKPFAVILDDSETVESWPIEESGRYATYDLQISLSKSGRVRAAWIRRKMHLDSTVDEIICFSESEDGMQWTKPLQVYTLKREKHSRDEIRDISLVGYGKKVFVFWRITEKGEFLAEIEGNQVQNIKQISGKEREQVKIDDAVERSPATMAVDHQGNLYVLSVVNSAPKRYRMFLKARINGEWTKEAVISEDTANFVQSVDLKIDVNGAIHVVYYLGGGRASYYMKVTRN